MVVDSYFMTDGIMIHVFSMNVAVAQSYSRVCLGANQVKQVICILQVIAMLY